MNADMFTCKEFCQLSQGEGEGVLKSRPILRCTDAWLETLTLSSVFYSLSGEVGRVKDSLSLAGEEQG